MSGRRWGFGGVWLEPFTREGARRTCETILSNYRRPRARFARAEGGGAGATAAAEAAPATTASAASAATAAAPDNDDDDFDFDDGGGEEEHEAEAPPPPPLAERPCSHVACSTRPYCLIPPLQEAQSNYSTQQATAQRAPSNFKRWVIDRCVSALKLCPFALDSKDDVHVRFGGMFGVSHRLADRTFEKLWEVVDSGDLMRNAVHRADPRIVALRELMKVQGIGLSKAARLHDELGCRDVSDLLRLPRGELSKQQRLGAKHFEDFAEPVPRGEVAVVQRAFRVAAAAVWRLSLPPAGASKEALLLPPPPGSFGFSPSFLEVPDGSGERAFAEGVGSYRRGARATVGDIDILLSPPPPPPLTSTANALLDSSQSSSQDQAARRRQSGTGTAAAAAAATTTERRSASTRDELIADLSLVVAEMRRLGFELEEGSSSSRAAGATTADGDGCGEEEIAHASFSGAVRCPVRPLQASGLLGPASPRPRFRRLDVKLYPRRALPAALCYFSSGMAFSRCLRQWSHADSAAARAALLPLAQRAARLEFARTGRGTATTGEDPSQADSFHLSDKGLEVTRRGALGSKARVSPYVVDGRRCGTRVRNPQAFFSPSVFVPLSCETDLFEALGLEYCPPHLRDLEDASGGAVELEN